MESNEKKIIDGYAQGLYEEYQGALEKHGSTSEITKNYFARWGAVRGLMELLQEEARESDGAGK